MHHRFGQVEARFEKDCRNKCISKRCFLHFYRDFFQHQITNCWNVTVLFLKVLRNCLTTTNIYFEIVAWVQFLEYHSLKTQRQVFSCNTSSQGTPCGVVSFQIYFWRFSVCQACFCKFILLAITGIRSDGKLRFYSKKVVFMEW